MLGQTYFSKIHAEQLEGKIGSRLMQAMCSGVYCWYSVISTSDTMSFSLILVTTSKMPGTGANNASTFHIAITGNQAIVNYELFRKRTESPVQHFNQRVFRGVIYIPQEKND